MIAPGIESVTITRAVGHPQNAEEISVVVWPPTLGCRIRAVHRDQRLFAAGLVHVEKKLVILVPIVQCCLQIETRMS
jgi:hypothetical protein